jgi:hypothetical protein
VCHAPLTPIDTLLNVVQAQEFYFIYFLFFSGGLFDAHFHKFPPPKLELRRHNCGQIVRNGPKHIENCSSEKMDAVRLCRRCESSNDIHRYDELLFIITT